MELLGFLSILAALKVCGASPPVPLVTDLTAVLGETVILPCDGSAYIQHVSPEEVSRSLEWTMMWGDVLSQQGEGLVAGRGYEGRVFVYPESLVEGNFSLELRDVVLSDGGTYECVWQGRRTISTVWLNVAAPPIPTAVDVPVGNSVHLPCYGNVYKNLDPKQVEVVWQRDGQTIVTVLGDRHSVFGDQYSRYIPRGLYFYRLGNFTLTIASVRFLDQGKYSCFYRPRNFAPIQLGTPASIHLTVNETLLFHEEDWPITASVPMLSDDFQEDSRGKATATPISATATPISAASSRSAREQDEAKRRSLEPGSDDQLETLPWVRIGIIAGVLSLTVLVLGILLATHKI